MSPINCGSIHLGHEWFSDDSRGRQKIFMCLAALLCEQFCRFTNGGAKISIKSCFMRSFYSQCILSVNCRLQPAGLGKKRARGMCEANLLYVESDFRTTDTSFTVFFARRGVKFDRRVKISVKLNYSIIELHVPSRRKKSLQSYL